MSPNTPTDPTTLTQTFHHSTSTHTYSIKWVSIGSPNSPPLVFIHGTPWSSRVWTALALALSRQYHVYLFDNPGFGDSPIENSTSTLPDQPGAFNHPPADDDDGKVTELDADLARQSEVFAALYKSWEADWADDDGGVGGKKGAHVIAHDHGGLMSLRAYLLHGCHYASLCLLNVVAIGPFGQPLFKSVASHPEYFQQLPNLAFEGILESYIRNAAFTTLFNDTMDMLKAPWLRDEVGKEGFIRQLCQANWRSTEAVEGRYGEVGEEIPVKVVWGTEDRWIPVETAVRLGDALKAREVVEIEGAGHLVMYDQPAQLGVEIARWLGAVG